MKLKNEQLKKQILLVATDLIIKNGIEGTSTVKVARKINMAQSNIYSYFKNRQQLLLAVFIFHQRKLIDDLSPLLDSELTPINQINQLIREIIQFGKTNFNTMRILTIFRNQPMIRPILPKISDDDFFTELFELVKQYQQQGIIKPINSEFLMEGVFSIINNYLLAIEINEINPIELTSDIVVNSIDNFLLV